MNSTRDFRRTIGVRSLAVRLSVLASLAVLAAPALRAQVPAVVSSSTSAVTTAGGVNYGPAVTDKCGNVYVNGGGNGGAGTVIQYAANTGLATNIATNTYGYGVGAAGLAIDSSKTLMYFPTTTIGYYSSSWAYVNVSSCTPGGPTTFPANGVSYLFGYYLGTAQSLAVDGLGDVFFVPTANNTGNGTNYIAVISCGATAGTTACAAGTPPTGSNAAVITAKLPKMPNSLAADAKGDIFWTDGGTNVYELSPPYSSTPGTPTVVVSNLVAGAGVFFDATGNLYVADGNAYLGQQYYGYSFDSIVYKIPVVSGVLNPAQEYVVANQNLGIASQPAIDSTGNIFYTAYTGNQQISGVSPQNLYEITVGSAKAPSAKVGSSSYPTVNYAFNASVTPNSISFPTGTSASAYFGNSYGGNCATGTTYTAGKGCTVGVKYTPSVPGLQTGAVVLADSSNNALSTTAIEGIGLGASVTIDPGGQTTFTGTFTTPQGVAIDAQGNTYVADAGANAVIQFAPGATSGGTAVSTGTLTLSAPGGVAVDGLGNVYIADTGNNRIVEVPVLKGARASASSSALSISAGSVALKSPGGVAVDGIGNLYIADTGNNRIVEVPNVSGTLVTSAAAAYGTGLSAPLGVSVDLNGNVFVADTGNGVIERLTPPLASGTQLNVATGLSSPSAIAIDASGSLYVVNKGVGAVEKFPLISGLFGAPVYVGGTVAAPYGIAIDGPGNLVITDNTHATVTGIARVAEALPFGNWNVNTTSNAETATLGNSGNAALVFNSPDYTASGATTEFSVSSDTCYNSGNIVPGNSCAITAVFKPTKTETNATDTLALSSNAANGGPSLRLIGTGETVNTSSTVVTLTAPSSGVLSAGVSATFTATIGIGANTTAPTGYVTFYVNGSQDGPEVAVTKVGSSYQTALTFPNGLPAGAVTLVAVYSGDSNYSGSSGSINEIVIGLPASLVVTATTPYTNPQSANDNPANATGPSIPLTATLTVASKIIPTGKVSFYSGTTASPTLIGVGQLTPGSGGYQATVSETALRALTGTTVENGSIIDNYNIFAVYSGDNYYVPETSPSIPLLIVGPPATVPPCAAAPSMSITATSLSGGIATYSYTITGGTSTPAVGDIIAITGTTNGSGILNVASGTITSVKVLNSTTGTFTIGGFAAGTTLTLASDTGTVSNTCETNTTGAYFSITPTNPTITIASSGVSAPVSGTANLTVISYGGWNGILNFTCSNLPAYTTCNPFPAVPAISPSTPSAPNAGTPILFTINTNVQPPRSTAAGFAWWMCGLLGLGLLLARRRLRRVGMAGFGAVAGLVLLLAASTGAMTGCTTGFNVDSVKTPAGTTNVLVTVTAAQLVPNSNPVSYMLPDSNQVTFTVALTVK